MWEEFHARPLFRGHLLWSLFAAGVTECSCMLGYSLWLCHHTFPGTGLYAVLSYIYTSFQVSRATVEAVQKNLPWELGMWSGAGIIFLCHAVMVCLVVFTIP